MDPLHDHLLGISRRQFFGRASAGIGSVALASLLNPELFAAANDPRATSGPGVLPHFAPKAKRLIYLFQSGAPAQMDLFDYKPNLERHRGIELPDSIRQGQRLTGMTSGQDSFPVASSRFAFQQYGQSGAWISDVLPNTAQIVDELCIVRSMHTEAINHDPGITFFQTGSEQPGRPCFGSWISYGLGSENGNFPAFIVLISQGSSQRDSQPLFSRLWGSGFLPADHQGVQFRSGSDPVLYLNNPDGIDPGRRRAMLDRLNMLNHMRHDEIGDPEIVARIRQYEMAYRMQTSVPDLMDVSDEPEHVFELYGQDARVPGTYAANCLLARRLAERDVRFVQLYHRGWDQHDNLPSEITLQCRDTDRASAALILDLKQRGLLDDTLVIWGGEFGRTVYCQGPLTEGNYGRDHHPRCFTIWMAGGGVKAGMTYGQTDDYSYNVARDPVHVHDLQATVLHCLGIDHERLTYRHQGRDYRLTDVHGGVVGDLLAGS
jgi:hypothetical protein